MYTGWIALHGTLSISLKALNLLIHPPCYSSRSISTMTDRERKDRMKLKPYTGYVSRKCTEKANMIARSISNPPLSPCLWRGLCLQPMMKPSPWGSHQGSGWGSGGMSWGRDHRRGSGMGVPGSVSHVSPLKKPFSSNVIAPPKFPRSAGSLGPKSWIEENMFRTDSNSNTLLPLQVCVWGLRLCFGRIRSLGRVCVSGRVGVHTVLFC